MVLPSSGSNFESDHRNFAYSSLTLHLQFISAAHTQLEFRHKYSCMFDVIHEWDTRWLLRLIHWPKRVKFLQLIRLVSRTGDGHSYPVIAIAPFVLGFDPTFRLFKIFLAGFCIERSAYFVMKNSLRRKRPTEHLSFESAVTPGDRFSFPSGHTSAAFLVSTILALGFFDYSAFALIPLAWACAIGCSRILLGVHYPLDTIAGCLLGSSVAVLVSTNTYFATG